MHSWRALVDFFEVSLENVIRNSMGEPSSRCASKDCVGAIQKNNAKPTPEVGVTHRLALRSPEFSHCTPNQVWVQRGDSGDSSVDKDTRN
jgi:hypothetical protein